MRRGLWVDLSLCALLTLATIGTLALSRSVSGEDRLYLVGLALLEVLATGALAFRAIRASARHDQAIEALEAGQAYLAQPESYRAIDMASRHHRELQLDEDRLLANFTLEQSPLREDWNRLRCNHCDWQVDEPLADARISGPRHLDEAHAPKRRWYARLSLSR